MLKAASILALVALATVAARADEAADLVVGSVRDQNGTPIVDAAIVAFDGAGRPDGRDRSDSLGTFVVSPERPARALEVRCRHCRTTHIELQGSKNVALVVLRYAALESDVPDTRDLAALPYGAAVDALGLIPFTLPSGASISDRGLGGGSGLVLDDGAPLVDLSTGTPASFDFPDRYVRTIDVVGPEHAFRYGPDAGGGVFALDQLAAGQTSASFNGGRSSSLALLPSLGNLYPAAGVSSDGMTLARRADIDYAGPFDGGALRVGYGSGTEDTAFGAGNFARDFSTFRLNYATASRRYRTSADFYASDAALSDSVAGIAYRSSYLSADFLIEHPGPVTLSAGAHVDRETGAYSVGAPYDYDGRTNDATVFVEARAGDAAASVDAGLGLMDVAGTEAFPSGSPSGTHLAVLPSLSTRVALGGGTYARVAYSESARVPDLLEMAAYFPLPAAPSFERGELEESAAGFDDGGRVRGEFIAYREFTHGFDERRLDGIGASLVWQIAPLVSMRAWSLRASPLAFAAEPNAQNDASRQVVWFTYANGDNVRFDAIVHRDASALTHAAIALDGDVFLPIVARLAVDLGSAQHLGVRRYYAGLRVKR